MPDIQAAAALVGGVKTALDMVGTIAGIRDDLKLQTVQGDLKRQLLEVLDFAVTTKTDQLEFVGREDALKKEIAGLKEWKAREGEYSLEEIPSGAFAYVSKPTGDGQGPEVWLCPNCFESKQRSVLLYAGRSKAGHGEDEFKCQPCRTTILVEMGVGPGHWRRRMEELRKYRQSEGG